jgi:DNA polymerase-3 subunit gamma/tau
MSQVLARRYRPQSFDDVIGQGPIVQTLRNAIEGGRIAHGFIFSGHRGIGKTTVARILAKAMNCRAFPGPTTTPCGVCDACREIRDGASVDVIEIDAASNRGIEEIRALRENVRYRPARDRYKFYILDEAHQLTGDAFNALLKTLEEPPEWAVFVLATTEPEALPATIRSRCQHFSFRAVSFAQILERLRFICDSERVAADEESLGMIAEAGEGSIRDALSLLDQAIAYGGGALEAAGVRTLLGRVSSRRLLELLEAVGADSSRSVLERLDDLLATVSPAQLARQLLHFIRNIIVARAGGPGSALLETTADERQIYAAAAGLFSEEALARFLQIMLRTAGELHYAREERLHLELALMRMLHAGRLSRVEDVIAALESKTAGDAAAAPKADSKNAAAPKADPLTPASNAPARAARSREAPPAGAPVEAPAASAAPSRTEPKTPPAEAAPSDDARNDNSPAAPQRSAGPAAQDTPGLFGDDSDPELNGSRSNRPSPPDTAKVKKNSDASAAAPAERSFASQLANGRFAEPAPIPSAALRPRENGSSAAAPIAATVAVAEPDRVPVSAPDPAGDADRPPSEPADLAARRTQAVLALLQSERPTIEAAVSQAQWIWNGNRLRLAFAAGAAGQAVLAESPEVLAIVRDLCRRACGVAPDIRVERVAQTGQSSPASPQSPPAAPLAGSPEERAARSDKLRLLRELLPATVLKTSDYDAASAERPAQRPAAAAPLAQRPAPRPAQHPVSPGPVAERPAAPAPQPAPSPAPEAR